MTGEGPGRIGKKRFHRKVAEQTAGRGGEEETDHQNPNQLGRLECL